MKSMMGSMYRARSGSAHREARHACKLHESPHMQLAHLAYHSGARSHSAARSCFRLVTRKQTSTHRAGTFASSISMQVADRMDRNRSHVREGGPDRQKGRPYRPRSPEGCSMISVAPCPPDRDNCRIPDSAVGFPRPTARLIFSLHVRRQLDGGVGPQRSPRHDGPTVN